MPLGPWECQTLILTVNSFVDIKLMSSRKRSTTAELQLDEACALVETLPKWRVVEKVRYKEIGVYLMESILFNLCMNICIN